MRQQYEGSGRSVKEIGQDKKRKAKINIEVK